MQPQLFGSLAAQEHPLHKDLKIIHHRAIAGIDDQLELNQRLRLVDLQFRLFDGVIHPVVDIKGGDILVPDAAAADIGFIR